MSFPRVEEARIFLKIQPECVCVPSELESLKVGTVLRDGVNHVIDVDLH